MYLLNRQSRGWSPLAELRREMDHLLDDVWSAPLQFTGHSPGLVTDAAWQPACDVEKVEANYQDGVLRVFVPKAESLKPRQVKISNGAGAASGFFGKLLGQSPKKEQEVALSPSEKSSEKVA